MEKLKWKSEQEQYTELSGRISEWKEGRSRDGYIVIAEGVFSWKGIKYLINVLRYFNHTNKFTSMGSRISDKHVVVEYPKETEPFVKLVKDIDEFSEFLYHDTLHSYNDNQTTEEQIEECHRLAKEDIDYLLGNELLRKINVKIKRFEDLKKKLPKEKK